MASTIARGTVVYTTKKDHPEIAEGTPGLVVHDGGGLSKIRVLFVSQYTAPGTPAGVTHEFASYEVSLVPDLDLPRTSPFVDDTDWDPQDSPGL